MLCLVVTHNVPLVFQTPYSRIVERIIEPEAAGGKGSSGKRESRFANSITYNNYVLARRERP